MLQITLDEFATAFAFVMSSIFANRLLISVRANYYSSLDDVDTTYLPSVRFIHTRQSTTFAMNTMESQELRTFNERTGV